ncbi:hypothetical protein GCG54_00015391 [Colletotrichum gloeosporioides]|uniref:Uncharacterized protein n=1 Tax=Colletotrichum gloeosporioides TaxID=474922 RepID=A0A8H4FKV6_COLGL|nr:uncharacterized protein GCG54_00015391 [Colletotrichum gloeosporioides]KAF3805835.1 hypothetical protein GCG54_00015391 [Colletotrichum gloeosporioides]
MAGSNMVLLSTADFRAFEMVDSIKQELENSHNTLIERHEYVSRATLDNIGLAGVDHDFQSLKESETT